MLQTGAIILKDIAVIKILSFFIVECTNILTLFILNVEKISLSLVHRGIILLLLVVNIGIIYLESSYYNFIVHGRNLSGL
jgi:hypothetical protein